jgi:hypothetical protein
VKAVNTVVMMPMPSVTAKPRTGPVPMKNSTAAAMKVVMLESRWSQRALEAGVDRRNRVAAAAHLLADALVDQHVGVDRDADGQHDAGDAGQRQRRVEQRQHAEDHGDVDGDRDVGEHAEQP